ncbi:DNA mismatch repair protein MutT [Pseudomonas sp. NS1(2017)]|uniref:NUDIX hydrolase n=1 Tax=Pseudomonas sp. NS1(2017) TaxID=2025658 RepID=UPI000BA25237|nr:NUDIX domain-containing protein [Pseudomonas sp. NS1(2017)]ASV39049.1 DNA mismatch repair protein MutT [Pseudomonas sp. NS1(2017)]
MRERKASRLLVINPSQEVLLFRFVHKDGPLAGQNYWATPGGGVEAGETFEVAAIRELREETGIKVDTVAAPIADRKVPLMLPCGETVLAIEQYYVVHAPDEALSKAEWTAHETQVMADHRWWSANALRSTEETVWPQSLIDMLVKEGVFQPAT